MSTPSVTDLEIAQIVVGEARLLAGTGARPDFVEEVVAVAKKVLDGEALTSDDLGPLHPTVIGRLHREGLIASDLLPEGMQEALLE